MQKKLPGGRGTQATPETTGRWGTGQNDGFTPFLEFATQLIDLGAMIDVGGLQLAVKFTPVVHTSVDAAIQPEFKTENLFFLNNERQHNSFLPRSGVTEQGYANKRWSE
jgi:hypothetical protein